MSNTEHTYTVAGTSKFDGVLTYRFANDVKRMNVLKRNGHSDVSFVTLPRAMTLRDAVAFLKAQGVVAQLPYGQRKVQNGTREAEVVRAQLDAHVATWEEGKLKDAAKKADFVARMQAARAAKRQAMAVSG